MTAMPQDRRVLTAQLADATRDATVLRAQVADLLAQLHAEHAEVLVLRKAAAMTSEQSDETERVHLDAIEQLARLGFDPKAGEHRRELQAALRGANAPGRRAA